LYNCIIGLILLLVDHPQQVDLPLLGGLLQGDLPPALVFPPQVWPLPLQLQVLLKIEN
jgi:hypothetical protein